MPQNAREFQKPVLLDGETLTPEVVAAVADGRPVTLCPRQWNASAGLMMYC